jgi:outer membrane protein
MQKFKSLIAVSVMFIAASSLAQSDKPLSLKECIDYTLKNNPTTVIYDNQIRITEQQKMEALSGYLPQVNGSLAFDDNIKRQVTVIPAGTFGPTDSKLQFGNQYNTNAILQADQTIIDVSMMQGIKAAKPGIELAEMKKAKNEDDLIYNTASAYYLVLSLKEQLRLLSENEKKLGNLLAVQQLQLEKGIITEVSLNRVKVNYNNVVSQKKVAETNYLLALARLKNAMGIPVEKELVIADSLDHNKDVELPLTQEFNIKNKADYVILEKNLELQEIDLKRKRSAVYPTLSAYARYGANSFGSEFNKSYEQFYDYTSVGLKLNVPLFSGMRRHSQTAQSELNLVNARQNMIINSENMKLQYQSSNTQVLSYYTNLQNNKSNIELAKEVFESTSKQYIKGTATLTDFLNADYAYKEAQSNYLNALLNYLTARIDVERSKGTIKQFVNQL